MTAQDPDTHPAGETAVGRRYALTARLVAPKDVALGYKQLIEVEDAFRTLKHTLDLRPVYHRVEERIRAHVLLC